jgi:hypothetical protein
MQRNQFASVAKATEKDAAWLLGQMRYKSNILVLASKGQTLVRRLRT